MPDNQTHSVEILNELYAAEKRSLLPRLAECGMFVSKASARELELVRQMLTEEREHLHWLVDTIEKCRGSVRPAGADINTANLHYLDLHAVMPQVLAGEESLSRACAQALANGQMLCPEAATTINRIAGRHQTHLRQLRQVAEHFAAANA